MDNGDKLGKEIKEIMEEETFNLTLSQNTMDNIFESRKKTFKEKLREFLNIEIEITLAPIVVGFVALFVISIFPSEDFKSYEEKIIDVGGSQVIIREGYEVSKNEDED